MKHLVIALDGDRAVATTFSSDGKGLRFDGARHYSSGSSAEFAAGLDEIAAIGPYRDVTLLLDPDKVFARHITHPLRDRRQLRDVLPLELKGETAVDADQLAFEALPLSGGRVLAFWTRRHDLREKIDALTRAGLEPRVVTVPGCGWGELVPSAQCHGITDGRTLAVFANGEPVLLRAIGADLFHELQRSLAALEVSCERLDALYLTGSVHNLPPMPLHDIDAVPLPVEGALDAAFSGGFESARVHAGAYAAARAALTRDCVNFRHGEFAYTADLQAFRRSLRKTAVLAGILAVLVMGRYGFKMYQVNKDISSLDSSITRIYREVFPTRSKAADPVGEVASEIRRLGDGSSGSSLLVVLNRLAEAKTDDISAVYEIEADGVQLRVKGDARSIDAVSGFRTRLAASFADVEQGETKSRPSGGVTFAFRATVKEGGQ